MKQWTAARMVCLLALGAGLGCSGGGEAGDGVGGSGGAGGTGGAGDVGEVTFQGSECKSHGDTSTTSASTAGIGQKAQALDAVDVGLGLECILWSSTSSGGLSIEWINFTSGCGHTWEGTAEMEGATGTLRLRIGDPRCMLAGCGNCIYDASFDLDEAPTTDPLPVELVVDQCSDAEQRELYCMGMPEGECLPPEAEQITLSLTDSPEGFLCRYSGFGGGLGEPVCGKQLQPCASDFCVADGAGACDPGLECHERPDEPTERMCQQPCSSDDDCDIPVLTCRNGFCQLAEVW